MSTQHLQSKEAPPRWWYCKTKTDTDGRQTLRTDGIEIDLIEFLQWLYDAGFRYTKIYENGILFKIENSKILREIEVSEMAQYVVRWVQHLPLEIECNSRNGELQATINQKLLLEKIIKGISFYFDKKRLESFLGPKETFIMNQDGPASKFMYFTNGYLHINARGIAFFNYSELPGHIWASEVIQRPYTAPTTTTPGMVETFFNLVANGAEPATMLAIEAQRRATRFADLCNIAGYLGHSYTSYQLKAILLTDAKVSDSNEPNGRSGKSLFMLLISAILCADASAAGNQKTVVNVPGKNFDPTDTFRYQQASHETKLIYLNDVKRGFRTETLFNDITDGLTVNRKNKASFTIKVKMVLISNLSIDLAGESNKARFCVFEFSDYFNALHDPYKEFKTWFFTGWDDAEYNRTYTFLAQCCRAFFADACQLPQPESINYQQRIINEHTSRDFVEYMEADWKPIPGQMYDLRHEYTTFLKQYPDWAQRKLAQSKFTIWIQKYMNNSKEWANYTKVDNYHRESNGSTFIKFIKPINPIN